jgi:cell division protein FtsI (penicillin-binding protein 3)
MARNAELRPPHIVLLICLAIVVWILLRLIWVGVINANTYSAQAEETRTITVETTAKRGTIYDRNGIVLAASVDATTIYCNPTEIEDADYVAGVLVEVLGGAKDDYTSALRTANTTFAYIKRQGDVDTAKTLKEKVSNDEKLTGIYFLSDTKRQYPNGQVGGQIIGMCDPDGNGVCGLEKQYDEILKGENGSYKAEHSAAGNQIPGAVKEDKAATPGQDIMISIDISCQAEVENYLSSYLERIGSEKGSVVLMDSSNGEIYAACSYPYFDPSNPQDSITGSETVLSISNAFEPGSTMKTVSALGILEAGAMSPSDSVYCPVSITADEYTISDAYERGGQTMTLDQILTRSSNVGISLASDKIGQSKIYENLLKSKVLEKTGIDFPGEAKGYVSDVSKWSTIQRYNVTFGQGITVAPIALLRFYAALANDGTAVTPHFLISKTQSAEYATYETENLGYSSESLSDIKAMLQNVVDNNTENQAGVDGYQICGKTSTAEYVGDDGKYVSGRYNLGFAGFINNASTKLACYVGAMNVGIESNVTSVFGNIMSSAITRYKIVPNAS